MKNIVVVIKQNGLKEFFEIYVEMLDVYDGLDFYMLELVVLVKGFQKEVKLIVDGIVGKNMIKVMVGEMNVVWIVKVELVMEWSCWIFEDFGECKVFINQVVYMVIYSVLGEDFLFMCVVVGKKFNQINFFYDEIEIVEYNLYWGVLYLIIVNEMILKLVVNLSYFDQVGYEVMIFGGCKVFLVFVDWYVVVFK